MYYGIDLEACGVSCLIIRLFLLLLQKSSASREEDGGDEDEDEDEDEESGDEADLSKYDLWGSDEEQDKSKAGKIGNTFKKSFVWNFNP